MNKDKFFIGIGPSKTGSTWLYRILQQHPEVAMPPIKKIKYFSLEQNIGKTNIIDNVISKYYFIKLKLIFFFLKFKKFKVEDTIIICGEARSGTTWLAEILNQIPYTCINWEPLRQENGVIPRAWNWGNIIFFPKEDKNKQRYQAIENILCFRTYNEWTIGMLSVKSLVKSKRVITKFVRANLLLPYILENFNLKNKPILIIRHPVDVCLSLKKNISYKKTIPKKIPSWKNSERFLKETNYLKSLTTVLEYNIAVWCINNCPLLEDQDTLEKIVVVFYSDLILNPEKETRSMLNKLSCVKKTDIDTIIASINFTKPSRSDFLGNYISNAEQQLQKNILNLSTKEKDSVQKVFDHFNFKLYDAYSIFPKKEYLYVSKFNEDKITL